MGDVAVVGPVTIDRVVQDGEGVCKRGGVITYAGLTFAELGLATRAVTRCAAEDGAVLEPLRQRGVEIRAGQSPATTRFVNYVAGDARRQDLPTWAGPLAASQLRQALDGMGHVHLGPLHPDDIGPEAIAAIPGAARVSLDLQGYVRRIEAGRVGRGVSANLYAALQRAEFVKASGDELELVLAHCGRPFERLRADCAVAEWVVTQGSRGGWVVDRSGLQTDYPAVAVARAVDATGAGDVFFAAYMAHRLHRGQAVADSLACAAGLAARQVGGEFIDGALLLLAAD